MIHTDRFILWCLWYFQESKYYCIELTFVWLTGIWPTFYHRPSYQPSIFCRKVFFFAAANPGNTESLLLMEWDHNRWCKTSLDGSGSMEQSDKLALLCYVSCQMTLRKHFVGRWLSYWMLNTGTINKGLRIGPFQAKGWTSVSLTTTWWTNVAFSLSQFAY